MGARALLEFEATITDRGQTTVPSAIRTMLGVSKGTIIFKGLADGTVVIEPKPSASPTEDPVIGAFLNFLGGDITSAPGSVQPLSRALLDRSAELVAGIDVDLDAPPPDD